ncbi:MAG: DNA repair protein RadC, partial [Polyangiales bacterium]
PEPFEIATGSSGTGPADGRFMDGPRERLARLGAAALSDAELVALLLGTGQAGEPVGSSAVRILRDAGGLWALARMSVVELSRIAGVGPAKAARLAAAFEAGSRGSIWPATGATPLSNSELVFNRYGRRLMNNPVERFLVISVDAKNRARAEREVARGGRTTCQVDPSEVFRLLITESASGAIFVHNHPSGDPAPSPQDLELTARLLAAGSLLGIRILDHLIVGNGQYTSLRDAGLWPVVP